MNVMIVGAGKAGTYLAEKLSRRHEVTVVEQRLDRADRLRMELPMVRVVVGDACEPTVLEHAKVAEADLLCAVTGDDEDNLVASWLAKSRGGVPRVLARVNHPRNEWLFTGQWGIDGAVSSAASMLALVEARISAADIVAVMRLAEEGATIEQIELAAEAAAVGRTLAEVPMPDCAKVVAVFPEAGGLVVPSGSTRLGAGDRLVVISQCEDLADVHDALGLPTEPA